MGIYVSRDQFADMIWPDMLWFWIIAYDLWNFAYVYNCVGDHSFYAGAALLISCTIPAFFLRRGRVAAAPCAHPGVLDDVHDGGAVLRHGLGVLGGVLARPGRAVHGERVALAANVAVAVYQVRRIVTRRLNPLRDELFTDLPAYRRVVESIPGSAGGAVAGQREPAPVG